MDKVRGAGWGSGNVDKKSLVGILLISANVDKGGETLIHKMCSSLKKEPKSYRPEGIL